MKLSSVQIQNFRSFKDETITFDDYTCLVGPNGCGKSTVLMALNVFFRNTAASVTNVLQLSREDFHHRNTENPIIITLTFVDLSPEAIDDFKLYYRQEMLTISAKATWNSGANSAEVKQYGERMVMEEFGPYFKAEEDGAKAAQLKEIFDKIRESFPDLPIATSGPTRIAALRAYEESHPDKCVLVESANEFFGFTKGANLLSKYLQWVYMPAVKEASSEQDEGAKTALGQLFQRSVRTKVNFKDSISEMKKELEKDYRNLIEESSEALDELSASIQMRLREWANPDATIQLAWQFDPNRAVSVQEPIARASLGEDSFIGEVARLGHGMQRCFLLALLQELASSCGSGGPTLILGIEEPELYQHPSQALHMSDVLESLAQKAASNSQVMISTHSPHFAGTRGFESVRVVRKHHSENCSLVASTTFEAVEKIIADAVGAKPDLPSVTMTSLEQIMQPSQRELYFTKFAVLVEGIEDIAFIATHLKLTNRWTEFRKHGCHFIIAMGKTNLSRPIAIARELCIPYFVVFDGDSNDTSNKKGTIRDNTCLFRLLEVSKFEEMPSKNVWGDRFVVWSRCIFDAVKEDIGSDKWDTAELQAKVDKGYVTGVKQKNNMLIAAVLEELGNHGIYSQVLTKLCDNLLLAAGRPPEPTIAVSSHEPSVVRSSASTLF